MLNTCLDPSVCVSRSKCSIGVTYWLAMAGTIATCISSSLAIWTNQRPGWSGGYADEERLGPG